ncbi:DUF6807 family protein [Streptomyces stelliscabiei]|uniref:DUF6807 family protein n=1 Tax=Streptomyces stelliscabiei TaxID=146820 RepID=UPI002FF15D6B
MSPFPTSRGTTSGADAPTSATGPDRTRQPRLPAPHRLPAAGPRRFRRGTALGGVPGELLRERRTVAATELTESAWALDFTFSLTNTTDAPVSIGSPATNGRPGAAYGGFFWRARKEAAAPRVFTADAEGESAVHGAAPTGSPWPAACGRSSSRGPPTPPAATRGSCAPRSTRSRLLPRPQRAPCDRAGETAVRRVVTVVADGILDRGEAAALARKAVSA